VRDEAAESGAWMDTYGFFVITNFLIDSMEIFGFWIWKVFIRGFAPKVLRIDFRQSELVPIIENHLIIIRADIDNHEMLSSSEIPRTSGSILRTEELL